MSIDRGELLAALGGLTTQQLADIGLQRVSDIATLDNPFKPQASTPDRVRRVDEPSTTPNATRERWYQLQQGDTVAELHETAYPHTTVVAVHRYRRVHTPVTPQHLLDGFDGVDTVLMSDLAGADEPAIWARLADHAAAPPRH